VVLTFAREASFQDVVVFFDGFPPQWLSTPWLSPQAIVQGVNMVLILPGIVQEHVNMVFFPWLPPGFLLSKETYGS
jgi:hypothetical protein